MIKSGANDWLLRDENGPQRLRRMVEVQKASLVRKKEREPASEWAALQEHQYLVRLNLLGQVKHQTDPIPPPPTPALVDAWLAHSAAVPGKGGSGSGSSSPTRRTSPLRRRLSTTTRKILVELVQPEHIDLSPFAASLSMQTLAELASAARQPKTLRVVNWSAITTVKLRPLMLQWGPGLEGLDLSGSAVTDEMMESACGRFESLRSLTLSSCAKIDNATAALVAAGCADTLTACDLSGCRLVSHASLSRLAGCIGLGNSRCRKLRSLDVSGCRKVMDVGLTDLGRGCPGLRFLNVMGCERLTDVGILGLTRGCRGLRVLNVKDCQNLTNASLAHLGANRCVCVCVCV